MFISRCKTIVKVFVSLVVVTLALIGFRFTCVSKLAHLSGEHEFYLYSSSSQAQIKTRLTLFDGFFVKGESVKMTLSGVSGEEKAKRILNELNAELLFTEKTGGTISYYGYAQKLGGGIVVDGVKINLQIATTNSQCVVGTPIIFGGF